MNTALEGHPGQLPACLHMREVHGHCQQCTLSLHSRWHVTPLSVPLCGQFLRRNTQVLLFSQKCSSPTYLTPQLRNGFSSNKWGTNRVWQPQSKEALHNTQSRLWLPQHQSHTIKGITASTDWGKMWDASILKTGITPKILDSCRLYRDAPIYKYPSKTTK